MVFRAQDVAYADEGTPHAKRVGAGLEKELPEDRF